MMKANKKVMAALLAAMMTVSAGATLVSAAEIVAGPGSTETITNNGTWYRTAKEENGKIVYKYSFKNADGTWAQGWKLINNTWYFFNGVQENGVWNYYALADGSYTLPTAEGNKEFRFNKNCAMITGWYQTTATDAADPTQTTTAGNWEYYNANGVRQYGWYKDGANWYYTKKPGEWVYKINADGTKSDPLQDKGQLLMNGTYEISGVKYTFAANGVMQNQGQGWVKEGDKWYYVEKGDKVVGGFADADSVGTIYTANSWRLINGKYYIFNTTGEMMTGWVRAVNAKGEAKWYYCDANGALVMNNWIQIGGAWYLTNPSGEMLTGWQVKNGKTYLLNTVSNQYGAYGAMVTGTRVPVATNAYATFDASGALVSIVNDKGQDITLPSLPQA